MFESDYGSFTTNSTNQKLNELVTQSPNGYTRQNFAYMIHGVPPTWSDVDFQGFLNNIKGGAQMLYVSDRGLANGESIYDGFGADWGQFVGSLALLDQLH